MNHPYREAPDYRKWRNAVSTVPGIEVDPVVSFPFQISRADKIATAGSCFAQHIARSLSDKGFNYYVAEKPHFSVEGVGDAYNYNLFSARYGNIYTSRQLLQLAQRALGHFTPDDEVWQDSSGAYVDPLRPTIQPGGFISVRELDIDRTQHLAAVRTMLHELDYLVFTLGLTEHWYRASDGAAYPLCPGVAGGEFDPERHRFANLEVEEVVDDMEAFFALLKQVNPRARMILTVSPVALAATAEDRHVLVSTTHSKAVLRVAAERLTRRNADIAYFPSYEIVLGPHGRGAYLADDLREVNAAGVAHVMRLFARHATVAEGDDQPLPAADDAGARDRALLADVQRFVKAECDEAMLGAPEAPPAVDPLPAAPPSAEPRSIRSRFPLLRRLAGRR